MQRGRKRAPVNQLHTLQMARTTTVDVWKLSSQLVTDLNTLLYWVPSEELEANSIRLAYSRNAIRMVRIYGFYATIQMVASMQLG